MEGPENEGDQAKNIEVHSTGSIPAADKNEQADKQIKQAHDTQVILDRQGLFRRCGKQRRLELLTTARELIANLGPQTRAFQPASHLSRSRDRDAIEVQQGVAGSNPGTSCRRIWRNLTGLNSVVRIEPGYPVVHHLEAAALIEIDQGKNHVQTNVHCLVDAHAQNPIIFNSLI